LAISGFAAETTDSNVDFPALGNPTSPTSAKTFNSRIIHSSLPGRPGCEKRGVCWVDDLKCQLPSPPFPPGVKTFVSPSSVISNNISPVSAFLAMVPNGTSRISSLPFAPVRNALPPGSPFAAMICFLYLRCRSVQCWLEPLSIMWPPRPPSPPSGPPLAVNLSLCRCAEPAPPCPERQHTFT